MNKKNKTEKKDVYYYINSELEIKSRSKNSKFLKKNKKVGNYFETDAEAVIPQMELRKLLNRPNLIHKMQKEIVQFEETNKNLEDKIKKLIEEKEKAVKFSETIIETSVEFVNKKIENIIKLRKAIKRTIYVLVAIIAVISGILFSTYLTL